MWRMSALTLPALFCMGLGLAVALAETQSRGVFVSPTTGVGVGSVWGVFIGVSDYQQKDLNLKYADKDAQALHEFFVGQFKGRIPADQFRLLTNGQATRGKVLKEVSEVLRLAQPEDLVVLSLALHGLPDASGQDLYFLAYDADANLPEDRGISRDDLIKQISRSKARKIVLLVDACHAGAFGSSPTLLAMRSANAADINRMLVAMGQAQDGIAVLSASSAAERSLEGPQFCGGHGAFTCALLNGLKGAADADGNGLVQMRELYDYAYRDVKRLTTGYQNPEIQGRYDNGLPLALTAKKDVSTTSSVVGADSSSTDELAKMRVEIEALKAQMRRSQTDEPKPTQEARSRPYDEPMRLMEGQANKVTNNVAHLVLTAGGKSDLVREENGHGVFTKALMEGLSGKADLKGNGTITALGLGAYIQERVSARFHDQHPQIGRLLGEGDVILSSRADNKNGKSLAIVVGINKYRNVPSLQFSTSDAIAISERLKSMGFEVRLLLDEQATRDTILSTLGDEIGDRAGENDRVVFYFAGHGETKGQEPHEMGFILPSDYDPKKPIATGISLNTLRDISRTLKAKHMVYFFDAAFSGGILFLR